MAASSTYTEAPCDLTYPKAAKTVVLPGRTSYDPMFRLPEPFLEGRYVTPTAQILSEVPLFALLDDQERELLAERLDVIRLPKGDPVFYTGDPGQSLYVVRSGEVEVFVKNDTGERIVIEIVRPGDFFGEISLLDGDARTASAVVTEDLEALLVDREDLAALFKMKPEAAMDILAATGKRLRESARLLRRTASRNVNEETEDTRSVVMRTADWIANFSGSLLFLFIHIGLFTLWIVWNVVPWFDHFDPFPFGFLTMCVSLEAIILSVFVLLSQNRQIERDRVRNDIEYAVNLKAELEIAHMHEKVDHMHAQLMKRLERIEATRLP